MTESRTMVLDLITLGHALDKLTDTYLPGIPWQSVNPEQQAFLTWLESHRDELLKLDSLEALASRSADELNKFLTDRGFDAVLNDLNGGIGVVSILDMLVKWLEGTASKDTVYTHFDGSGRDFPAVTITPNGVSIWAAARHAIAQLHTQTGHSLWLTMPETIPNTPLELALTAQQLAAAPRGFHVSYEGATVPMLNLSSTEPLEWLLRLWADPRDGGQPWSIDQAIMQFRLGLNDKGARVRVASALGASRGRFSGPIKLVFNQPFIGWFTQPGHDKLAIAAFCADYDVWENPGSLEDDADDHVDTTPSISSPPSGPTGSYRLDSLLRY